MDGHGDDHLGGRGLDNVILNTGARYNPADDTWTTTDDAGGNVAEARRFHTAVWTGTEMIIWGGNDTDGNRLNTGARYDPDTNSWATMNAGTNLPEARSNHTAVWTGTEMVVWGGSNGTIRVNTGARYNPTTDSWATIKDTGTGVPSARIAHTSHWTGTEMIIWGGFEITGLALSTGGRYDPATDSWTATDISGVDVPEERGRHSAVWTGTEMIIWGGFDINGFPVNTGATYNPIDDFWTEVDDDLDERGRHAAVWTGTQMIIWGGQNSGAGLLHTGAHYTPSEKLFFYQKQ